ncbi:MAG TPA: helix-turn-helix domain-containing protein [Candidatus Fimivivens sp.]|nr:helix-turn-helix domain-containing protein [Candidatus Fimivivens sp.]
MTAANFTRKRVGSLTLGEKLRKVRADNRISLSEVSRATSIQVKYLEALESGAYGSLPPEVYVRGFLRAYAAFLGIPEEAILKLYERERSIRKNLSGAPAPSRFHPKCPIRFQVPVSTRGVVLSVIAVVVIGSFSYLYFQFQTFISEPRLVLLSPRDGDSLTVATTVVSGESDPRATVRINGGETTVDERGAFSEELSLTSGLNTIVITSENRFGKTRTRTVAVNAVLPPGSDVSFVASDQAPTSSVRISVRATIPTHVSVRVDGETVWNGTLPSGETRPFSARERIEVQSDVGNAVLVRQDDGGESPVSEDPKPSTTVYGPDGRG